MENRKKKLLNKAFDTLYNLKYGGRNGSVLNAKIEIFLDELTKEALNLGYEFKLNDRNQKFRLLKIK